ncbi:MAG: DUF1800 domain-containing protein [Phycisphaerae bacterium]|nr:DUF1800 domain-containing protein [Phycisphaerae bacterium]MCZ2398323.1 DUF1800 domain-containing protein [Phycisphaerae bacterium]
MSRSSPMLLVLLAGAASVPAAGHDRSAASLEALPAAQWDAQAAAHLLRRAGFGGTPAEVERLHRLGVEGAVDWLVDFDRQGYAPAPPAVDPLVMEGLDRTELRGKTPEERREIIEQRRRAERESFEEIRLWWIERMATTPRPLEERMTLFWHGHFTSGMREVRRAQFMLEQNEFLRRRALDSFRELLIGISRDRGMLTYLDGNRNVARAPNENYARELLELFTLGIGNYTEADIKAAARAFTGWSYNESGFIFRRAQHDGGPKRFLGRSGNLTGEDVIDAILEQPACARFLARKLLEYFVRPDPPRELVEALAREIRRQKYALRPVMRTLLKSRAFYHPEARGSLVRSPVDVVIGTARTLGVPVANLPAAQRALTAMGQELMQPPNVKGWDGGKAWINTATLFTRYNTVGELIHGAGDQRAVRAMMAEENDEAVVVGDASLVREPAEPMKPRKRLQRSGQPAYDALAAVQPRGLTTPEQIVDFYAGHLLAAPLPAAKREELVRYLAGPDGRFTLSAPQAAGRIRTMIHLLLSTPEYQMY